MNLQVYNGMTQLGFEKSHRDFRCVICLLCFAFFVFKLLSSVVRNWCFIHSRFFFPIIATNNFKNNIFSFYSFRTEQVHVALYMTAIASISNLVQKPIIKVLYSCSSSQWEVCYYLIYLPISDIYFAASRSFQKMAWRFCCQAQGQLGNLLQLCHPRC